MTDEELENWLNKEIRTMRKWIGVDLDATLVEYHKWSNTIEIPDKPIMKMVERVKQWLKEGTEVKIFTARAAKPYPPTNTTKEDIVREIEKWRLKHIGQKFFP